MTFISSTIDFFKNEVYRRLTISAFSVVISGTLFYHFVEKWSFVDSLYFSVITLTTVGYGDFYPQTDIGKIFTIFYVLVGIGIIFGFINELYDNHQQKRHKKNTISSIFSRFFK